MRVSILALILGLGFPAVAAEEGVVKINDGTLNLRAGPCKTADKLGGYGDGQDLTILEKGIAGKTGCGDGTWVKVKIKDGPTGYMSEAGVKAAEKKFRAYAVRVKPATGTTAILRETPCQTGKKIGAWEKGIPSLVFEENVASDCGDGIVWAKIGIAGQMGYAHQEDFEVDLKMKELREISDAAAKKKEEESAAAAASENPGN